MAGVLFLDTAHAVLKSRRAGKRVRARECFRIASVRHERRRIVGEIDFNLRQLVHTGNGPRLRTIREITVRQIKHRRHVLERKPDGFNRQALLKAMQGHVLAKGELVGVFQVP